MKKCLSILPYIGDDEDENSEADFEVSTVLTVCLHYVKPEIIYTRNWDCKLH